MIISTGKGKHKFDIFAITKYTSSYSIVAYEIRHLPSNTLLAYPFYFQSTARRVALELVALSYNWLQDKPFDLEDSHWEYIRHYTFNDNKQPLSYADWFEQRQFDRTMAYELSAEYQAPLLEQFDSLAWLPISKLQ